jgi:hypothetical protein
MKTATHLKDLAGWTGRASLYRLSEPLDGHSHVIVSAAVAPYSGPETYIFPADADGKVENYCELDGSFRGELSHAKALENAGYEISGVLS